MPGPARGVLREEPSASIAHARVCEGRGTALIRSPLLRHEAGNGRYTPRGSLRLRPVLSYSETLRQLSSSKRSRSSWSFCKSRFFLNETEATENYPLSLHDALLL